MKKLFVHWPSGVLSIALLAACGVASGGPGDPTGGEAGGAATTPLGTSLFLMVQDPAGAPLPGAAVTVNGTASAADGAGHLLLENLAPGRVAARAEAAGFAPAVVVVDLPPGAHRGATVRLQIAGTPVFFDANAGGVVQDGRAYVIIPGGALVDRHGQPVTGNVEAMMTAIDPAKDGLLMIPGPLRGAPAGGGETELETAGMVELRLSQEGLPVSIAPGAHATIEIVLDDATAARFSPGDVTPAWWLDLDAGVWREEGAGTMGNSIAEPGKLAWFADVTHFTWWNCDVPWSDKHCFDVTVRLLGGEPIGDFPVRAEGVTYDGFHTSYTNAAGHACVEIKRGETARLLLGSPFKPLFNPPFEVTGMGPPSSCGGGGAPCVPVDLKIDAKVRCVPGSYFTCPYSGPPAALGKGLCTEGRSYCNPYGTSWLPCEGEVLPRLEDCATPFDESCDGSLVDGCDCTPFEERACYSGPAGTEGVGLCHGGKQTCLPTGFGWGPCVGEVVPKTEDCATPEDEDCDGKPSCPPGTVVWSAGFPINQYASLRDAAPAPDGGVVFALGKDSNDPLDLGGGSLLGAATVVARFDPAGQLVWSKGFKTVASNLNAIAVDPQGNVLLTGYAYDPIDFGGGPVGGALYEDVFVVKLDAAGNHVWSRILGDGRSYAIAVDAAGGAFVGGTMNASWNLGAGSLGAWGKAFLVKLDAQGQASWGKSYGDKTAERVEDIAVDAAGNAVLVGKFRNIDLGGGPLTAPGTEVFIAKLGPGGNHVWSRGSSGSNCGYVRLLSVAVDGSGGPIVAGSTYGAIDFGGGALTSSVDTEGFVAKFSTNGQYQWGKGYKGADGVLIHSIAASPGGDSVTTGWQPIGEADFGGGSLGQTGYFAFRLDTNGGHVWSEGFGPVNWDPGNTRAVAMDAQGNAYVAGFAPAPVEIGGKIILQTHGLYLVKIWK